MRITVTLSDEVYQALLAEKIREMQRRYLDAYFHRGLLLLQGLVDPPPAPEPDKPESANLLS
ncbi:hypothetical protein [Sulfobacillus harzensis]|uniref:Uncharacterized protein n=1 Tax=Sulfobacillus harzensis TaxID=2729629 RepID=A0A7Y0Q2D5_9FIRM|nr:hypothetical protein [Sulfobacillus harzensis]NMP22220.1 hypothetical protein [Sulfobacillus harzensis]